MLSKRKVLICAWASAISAVLLIGCARNDSISNAEQA